MSAEILREAATLMRERASTATPGPWFTGRTHTGCVCYGCGDPLESKAGNQIYKVSVYPEGRNADSVWLTGPRGHDEPLAAADSEHVASWNPMVALAVADWLDHAASIFDDADLEADELAASIECDCPYCKGMPLALHLARIYLGRDS